MPIRRLLAACLLALPALAQASTLDAMRAFLRDTQTARTPFTQTVVDKSGRTVQQSRGELVLSRPGKFRWSVDKPYRQLVVGDGDRVWIYDEDLNQVVVRRMGAASMTMVWVASGHLEAYWESGLKPWDFAPGWVMIDEAGGHLIDYHGDPAQLTTTTLIMSNGQPVIDKAIMQTVAEVAAGLAAGVQPGQD